MSNKKIESLTRALQTAAQMFSERPFEQVQVAEIAARARCSSATIYEAYETKKGLFRAAMAQNSGNAWPNLTNDPDPPSLTHLMDFLSERMAGLATPRMSNFWRSVSVDTPHVENVMEQMLHRTDHLSTIVEEVRRCMDQGLLRRGDPKAVAYLILAGTGYEPLAYGLLFGLDATCGAAAILEAVLGPLVTGLGQAELNSFVAKSRSNGPPDEAARPSLLRYLKSAPETCGCAAKQKPETV